MKRDIFLGIFIFALFFIGLTMTIDNSMKNTQASLVESFNLEQKMNRAIKQADTGLKIQRFSISISEDKMAEFSFVSKNSNKIEIFIGQELDNMKNMYRADTEQEYHVIKIGGLENNKKYYYKVIAFNDLSEEYSVIGTIEGI